MKYKCYKHGEVEFTIPNANGDCFCHTCIAEMINSAKPYPSLVEAMVPYIKERLAEGEKH